MSSFVESAAMKRFLFAFVLAAALPAVAQQGFIQPNVWFYHNGMVHPAVAPSSVSQPAGLQAFVTDGKLRIGVQDTIQLAMLNNSDIQVNRINYEATNYGILSSYSNFDPVITAGFNPQRSFSQPTTIYTGCGSGSATCTGLNQATTAAFSQTFQSGTNLNISFNTSRSVSNSNSTTLNPLFSSNLSVSLSQPLLRNRGLLVNRAPILLARAARNQSRANFEAQVAGTLSNAVYQYWNVVQARENLRVMQMSLDLAEKTYNHDKRALELGALPQLDIYRSQAQAEQRRVLVIQAEAQLKEAEDQLRNIIGADLDPNVQKLDIELTDQAATMVATQPDMNESVQLALAHRAELESYRQALGADDINVQVAGQNMRPDLNVTSFYSAAGVGGNTLDGSGNVLTKGGFGDSWSQLTNMSYPTYGATLSLRLPLRNSSAAANLGYALANKKRDLYSKRRQEQSIVLQVRNAYHDLESNGHAIEAAQAQVTAAEKDLAAEQRKYELGAQTIFFVLDAQTQLAAAQQSLVQAQISYRNALTNMDYATGELLKHYHIELSN